MSPLSLNDPVFSNFLFYSGVVLIKTLLMSIWTSKWRLATSTFDNPEDKTLGDGQETSQGREMVDRIRRCHLNDMENVYPFVLLGLLYVTTKPDPQTALMVFRTFAAARITHTIVYINGIRQPCRVLAFSVGFVINIYMAVKVIMHGVW